ncbi:MAG: MlaD family protein [Kofleriaceae bacterium]
MSLLAQDAGLTRRVGAVTLLLGLAAIVFVVFVADRIEWTRQTRFSIAFASTGSLREGAAFVVAGRAVGTVEAITLDPAGGVVASVAIAADQARRIARDGDVFITSRGPLGERYLEIGPSTATAFEPLHEGDRLVGRDPPSLDRVLQRTWDNLTTAKQFAEAVAPEFAALRDQLRALGTTIDELVPANLIGMASLGVELDGLATEARQLRDVGLGGEPGLHAIADTLNRARVTTAQVRRVLDTLDAQAAPLGANVAAMRARIATRGPAAVAAVERAIARLRGALDKIDPLFAKVADLTSRLARGEGSIGRLMKDPEFPEDAKDLGRILKRHPWRILLRPRD